MHQLSSHGGTGVWQIVSTLTGEEAYAQAIAQQPMLASTPEPIGELVKTLTLAVYTILIVGTILFQGCTAWHYFTRAKRGQSC